MEWAASIRRLRQSNGWKQAVLAELLGVDQATVSRWERGLQTPEVTMRRKLVELMRSRVPEMDRLPLVSIQTSPNPAIAFDRSLRVLALSAPAADLLAIEGETLAGAALSSDFQRALERADHHGLWRGDVAAMRFAVRLGDARHAEMVWTPVIVTGGDVVASAQMRAIDAAEYDRLGGVDGLAIIAMDELAVA